MNISVIIPTRNAEKYIGKLIKKLQSQTISPMEIIIIDTNSKDKTKEICKEFKGINFIHINDGEFGHGKTRNQAAKVAKGDILVFMTQDAYPNNDMFLDELIKPLGKDNVVCSYGRQLPRENSSCIEVFSRKFNYGNADIIKSRQDIDKLGVKTFFFSNVCSAFVKEDFFQTGGFPSDTIMNEDMIIASKFIFNDKKTCYTSRAEVIHSHNYTYREQFKRNFDVGVVFADSKLYFGGVKSESEGIKFVKNAIKYLIQNKKIYLIPHLIVESGFKFIGYKLGYNYKKIPMKYVKKMSMHSFYFEQKKEQEALVKAI
ncbi:glycosyltransferase family 2 protein [Romboutsia lituseburensis]|uniref:glycosyltransferase family 2 protein n=1 Tax=Romboutsia lituseburensis TaxID=1537 RepID=UPI00215B4E6F|nr:glycosyltransferase [Romboutsia lituseburensis]MCR8745461.1 glycosyltransferase [Romboutsia lituseburensis]